MNPWTQVPVYLEFFFNETLLSRGTGFFWEGTTGTFLVTNRHNFTGRDNETGKALHTNLGIPNKVAVLCGRADKTVFTLLFDIWTSDDRPTWWVHRDKDRRIDVALFPVRMPSDVVINAANHLPLTDFQLGVTDEAFILGFPLKLQILPVTIWKRGTLAAEPRVTEEGLLDYYLLDASTQTGMSGSPVIARCSEVIPISGVPGRQINFNSGRSNIATRFLGVYSGRLRNEKNEDTLIGRVWRSEFISEIDQDGVIDEA
ncbi:serine protease [Sulfitobacter sp. R86518]|uniref:S1 family peptidase n=1 Tax=Sulfitobacter sp. R86518 TaxID=3093858 RepID=UPI0036DF668C